MTRMRIDQVDIPQADIFEILLDHFPDMIHSIDEKGDIVYTNKTAEKMLGYTVEELLGMNIRQIYADEVLDAVEKGFKDLKKRGDKTVESMLKARNGTLIPVEIRSFSIYDDHGNFLRTFSILRDLRAMKQLQNSLVHAGRLAAIGELASGVAHDINNPLTVIVLSNEMVNREIRRAGKDIPPAQIERLTSLVADSEKAAGSVQKLVSHLRSFSRGMAEKAELIDIHNILSDALFITNNKIAGIGAMLENNINKGQCLTRGLPNSLEQVFVNLINNACDAMADRPEKKLTITISPDKHEDTECWRCDVTDTGSGIPPELMGEMFHSFFTTKEKGKGTGLGLSISRGIARDHRGEIKVKSEVNKGTTFSVFLPKA
jgi:two-component system, NtrC family, sensor kinase